MSGAPKGTVNVERRAWDKDKYEQRAKDREEYGDEFVDGKEAQAEIRNRQEFQAAEPGAQGPAGSKRSWLKHREGGYRQGVPSLAAAGRAPVQRPATAAVRARKGQGGRRHG